MTVEDDLRAVLRPTAGHDTDRAITAERAVLRAAARSRSRARVRRGLTVAGGAAGIALVAGGLWALMPRGTRPPATPTVVRVPDVRGMREDQAWARLRALGLSPASRDAPAGFRVGLVDAVRPAPGTPVGPDRTVTLTTARTLVVSDLAGEPVTRLTTALLPCGGAPAVRCGPLRVTVWPSGPVRSVRLVVDGRDVPAVRAADGAWVGSLPAQAVLRRITDALGAPGGWDGTEPVVRLDTTVRITTPTGSARSWLQPVAVRPAVRTPDVRPGAARTLTGSAADRDLLTACLAEPGGTVRTAAGAAVLQGGPAGASLTVPLRGGEVLVCDHAGGGVRLGDPWCGQSVWRLGAGGAVTDPRLNVSCRTRDGRPTAFAWVGPRPGARAVLVLTPGGWVRFPVVDPGLPVRVGWRGTRAPMPSLVVVRVRQVDGAGRVLTDTRMRAGVAG